MAALEQIVANDGKQRFEFNADKTAVRACQGHSLDVDAEQPVVSLADAPDVLYHGTSSDALAAIMCDGLLPMGRQHVHLSTNLATACVSGMRKPGHLVLLRVDVAAMRADEFLGDFRVSSNNVWLAASIPPIYLEDLK